MTRNLTPIDVLRYVYNETSEIEDKKMQEELLTNEALSDEFICMSEAKTLLNKCNYSASNQTLQNILNYSKSQLKESAQ